MTLDAHQHFWHPQRGDYDWMPKDNATLHRAYTPADLAPLLARSGVVGTVLVQAAASVEETEYMLGLADATDSVKGVVGWIDFERPAHLEQLRRLSGHPKFLGVRPMIQDIPDDNWMLRDDIQWAYEAIVELDLTFDALGFVRHIPNFLTVAKRYPEMRIVFDHCLKPQIRDQMRGEDVYSEWAERMSRLADDTSGVCKFSGLVTEAGDGWTIDDIRPFADHVLKAFGPDRVMWGSDWPVCRLKADYGTWYDMARRLTSHLPETSRDQIFAGTVRRFYRLV